MTPLKAILVDDEELALDNLKLLVQEFCPQIHILAAVNNIADALKVIEEENLDILFLDIKINKDTGFDLLKNIGKINFEIIFITAYSEYALEAIKFSAIDYLLKPIDIEELKTAVKRVENKMSKRNLNEQIEVLLANFKRENKDGLKIALPSADGLIFISLENILICEAQSNYTKFYLKDNKTYLVAKTLKEYEALLCKYHFCRIHHTFIVNVNEIKKYVRGDGGYVIMNNDMSVDVSKRKKDEFLKKVDIFH